MDCFLLEGCKVLYRAALAILILYHRHMSECNTDLCWDVVGRGRTGPGSQLTSTLLPHFACVVQSYFYTVDERIHSPREQSMYGINYP